MIKEVKYYQVTIKYVDVDETKSMTIAAWSETEATGKVLAILEKESFYRDIEISIVEMHKRR